MKISPFIKTYKSLLQCVKPNIPNTCKDTIMSTSTAPESSLRPQHSKQPSSRMRTAPHLRSKIFYSLFGLVVVVEIVVFGLVLLVADSMGRTWAREHLEQESNKLIAQMHNTDYLAFWGQYPYRISLITESGAVVYDNRINTTELDNHRQREEVQAALESGRGYMERKSTSTKYKSLYYARYVPEFHLIVRISINQQDVYAFFLPILGYMGVILALGLALSALLAHYLTRSIIAPLNTLSTLDSKSFQIPYAELAPFFTKIIAQKKQLKKQLKIIRRQQQQFQAISQNINEGVVLLDSKRKVLGYNASARAILPHIDSGSFGAWSADSRAKSSPPESKEAESSTPESSTHAIQGDIFSFIDFSSAQIQTNELQISDTHIECIALPIWGKTKPKAFAVLLLDRSQMRQIQAMRREFSANVTHELKTPLSVIMASSEMMKQGLIAEKDFMLFFDKIYEECKRLLEIINDILKLSFFDEGGKELEKTPVRMYELAQIVLHSLAPLIEEKHLHTKLVCKARESSVLGVTHLLQDMLYNLCENAIKYNKENGALEIFICNARAQGLVLELIGDSGEVVDSGLESRLMGDSHMLDLAQFTLITPALPLPQNLLLVAVCDSGIGIPSGEIARVFERFYRVDKSRSKKLGGTGLGLSIVKHIALYHGAQIFIRSEVGQGSEVVMLFKR